MSNVQTGIENAQDALDIVLKDLAVLESNHSKEILSYEKGSASTTSRRVRKSAKAVSNANTKEGLCALIMESLRALKAHGIEAIEHKALSKNYSATDVMNKMVFGEIAKIGEPEEDWDTTTRGTVFVKSSSV
jgi:hypothetical protein